MSHFHNGCGDNLCNKMAKKKKKRLYDVEMTYAFFSSQTSAQGGQNNVLKNII